MSETKLENELEIIIKKQFLGEGIAEKFLNRIKQGSLTIDENPQSHFCTYFAAYDPIEKLLFIGHHKKSGLWLFNGGHIDEKEVLSQTLNREIDEEWGLNSADFEITSPALITITEIYNPEKQTCRVHYDLWHFISVNKNNFKPDETNLAEEFYKTEWKNPEEARKLIKDKNTLLAVDFIENNYFNE